MDHGWVLIDQHRQLDVASIQAVTNREHESIPHLVDAPTFARRASPQLLVLWQFWIALTAVLSAVCRSLVKRERVAQLVGIGDEVVILALARLILYIEVYVCVNRRVAGRVPRANARRRVRWVPGRPVVFDESCRSPVRDCLSGKQGHQAAAIDVRRGSGTGQFSERRAEIDVLDDLLDYPPGRHPGPVRPEARECPCRSRSPYPAPTVFAHVVAVVRAEDEVGVLLLTDRCHRCLQRSNHGVDREHRLRAHAEIAIDAGRIGN